ncbi:MAG: 4-hydroxy-3-methylbut-2-enyl diphosphate reductase [Alphaproteobacteria bacterium]
MEKLDIIMAGPRGFCAGVTRAIEIVERALEKYGPPVYVRHEIVHNRRVVETLKNKGAIFVSELDEIPDGCVTIFSAHGVSEAVENAALMRNLPVIDATCPLVSKVHRSGQRHAKKGRVVVVVGHPGHPEVEGTTGRIQGEVYVVSDLEDVKNLPIASDVELAYVTQTTLSLDETKHIIDAIKEKYPEVNGPDLKDICYATQNRQMAVHQLCKEVDALIVLGAKNSSNSNRLKDVAALYNIKGYLIDDATQLTEDMLKNVHKLGISAGASAPEILVAELLDKLSTIRQICVSEQKGLEENIIFKLPPQLEDTQAPENSSLLPTRGEN